jgi:hypothetical protein
VDFNRDQKDGVMEARRDKARIKWGGGCQLNPGGDRHDGTDRRPDRLARDTFARF